MASGVQVGRVQFLGGAHAAVWHGTPESFTDLNPPGMTGGTFFYGTTGRVHVGRGFFDDSHLARAAINFNTTDSWMSLHQFLPERYTSFSTATSVCQDGDTLYVGGQAVNSLTGQYEAILWTGILVCYANCDASATSPALDLADFVCFLQRFNEGDGYANCDHSTTPPVLNVADFTCFLRRFAEGCP